MPGGGAPGVDDTGLGVVIYSSSTSKISVAPPGMVGGLPLSPYATSEGQVSLAFSPTFIFCRPSVQHLMTPASGNVAGSPSGIELAMTSPSGVHPVKVIVTLSCAPGVVVPFPFASTFQAKPLAVLVAWGGGAATSAGAAGATLASLAELTTS